MNHLKSTQLLLYAALFFALSLGAYTASSSVFASASTQTATTLAVCGDCCTECLGCSDGANEPCGEGKWDLCTYSNSGGCIIPNSAEECDACSGGMTPE